MPTWHKADSDRFLERWPSLPTETLSYTAAPYTQTPDVIDAYSPHFEDFQVTSEGSWSLVTARRKTSP